MITHKITISVEPLESILKDEQTFIGIDIKVVIAKSGGIAHQVGFLSF